MLIFSAFFVRIVVYTMPRRRDRDGAVATLAQGHQIARVMRSAVGEWDDVVHLFGWCVYAALSALFAERMVPQEQPARFSP